MKKLTILFLTLTFSMALFAQKVTQEQARQKAKNFFKDKGIVSSNPRRATWAGQQPDSTHEDIYVFNAENKGGFVIISGDERAPEVLGYADSGSLDMDTLPPNIKWWLSEYSKQIKAIDSLDITKRGAFKRAPKAAIATLMTTEWGQNNPYNMNCPDFFGQGNCFTGCVATAMAQVMYYHRGSSTNRTTAKIPGYKGEFWQGVNGQLTIGEIPEGAIIDWDNMLDKYNGSETTVQKEAVANLMLYCGVSVKMDYAGPGALSAGSAAYSFDVPVAMKQYFDYSENTTLVYRQDYTEEEWDELIYSELSKGNPIYYSGSNSEAGHAFVCDGFDGNGYYHINWGWDGLSDSFFLLSALNPSQQGTGGSSAGYNDGQCALIGAVPNGEIMRLTSQSVSLTGNTSFILSEAGDNITAPVKWEVQNMTGESCNFDHAIGLYYKGELVKVLKETGTSEMFTANQEKTIDASLTIETSLTAGIYQLYALSRSQGEEKWFRNENSSDCYITLVIKDGSMSFYVGKPAAAENIINFADNEVKRICVENWDTDGDGEISYEEAASVTDFRDVFERSIIKTFDEAQYFTGITSFGLTSRGGYSCSSLVSIKLPSSVTQIRREAFFGCYALTSIEIPATVKEIDNEAFWNCSSLQQIALPDGLEKINDEAFYRCESLSSVYIPASVMTIGGSVWGGCKNLNDFYVHNNNPNYCAVDGILFSKDKKELAYFPIKRTGTYSVPVGTEIINSFAFDGSNLEGIEIPESVTEIGRCAFQGLQNLTEITIPSSVTSIGKGLLQICSNLKSVILQGNVSVIPDRMCWVCSQLSNIELPNNITSIGSEAFYYCSNLKEIIIPSTITSIGDGAFSNSGLKKVTSLMQTPCTISSTVFDNINLNAVLFVPEESLTAYKEADNWNNFNQILPIGEKLIDAYGELNNGVLTLYYDTDREERAGTTFDISSWYDQRNEITKVIFDASFADARPTIINAWFYGCENLKEIQGMENLNTSEVSEMGEMFKNCHSLETLDLSNFKTSKVTSMFEMMWGCSSLKTVTLPEDLYFIDSGQFQYCASLTDISIPASVTSIGYCAFNDCNSLKEITIPADVTSIGDYAFWCPGITKVKSLMQTPCEISSTVFVVVSINATLYVPAGCKAAYEAADYWKDFKKIMGPSSNLIYLVDGEEYRSYEIEHGSAITPEPVPTKETYIFSGWSEIPEIMPDHDVIVTGTFERHFDVGHVVNVVNFIMGSNATPEDIALYDMNNDNELNIGDIILVVKNILNQSSAAPSLAIRRAPVSLDYAQYTAAQFELKVDKTASIKDIRLVNSMSQSHQLMYQQKEDNTYTVVVYSLSNQLMSPENGKIVDVEAEGGNVMIQNVTVATQTGEMHYYQDYGTPTGVHQLENDGNSAVIYDLKGNRLNGKTLEKGIYIINGKKAVVK